MNFWILNRLAPAVMLVVDRVVPFRSVFSCKEINNKDPLMCFRWRKRCWCWRIPMILMDQFSSEYVQVGSRSDNARFYNIASFDLLVILLGVSFFDATMAFEAVHCMLISWGRYDVGWGLVYCFVKLRWHKNNPPFVDVQTLHNRIVSDYHPWFCTHPFAWQLT